MMEHIRDFVEQVSQSFSFEEPVVEIGSFMVEGQHELANMRCFFAGKKYIGCDLRKGPGVDRIEDIQRLSFRNSSVHSLLVLETLEHVANPFLAFKEMYRILAPQGLLVISVPFSLPVHEFPSDYWRFTPYCLDMLLRRFNRFICWENAELSPADSKYLPRTIFAIASKSQLPLQGLAAIRRYGQERGYHFLLQKNSPSGKFVKK